MRKTEKELTLVSRDLQVGVGGKTTIAFQERVLMAENTSGQRHRDPPGKGAGPADRESRDQVSQA